MLASDIDRMKQEHAALKDQLQASQEENKHLETQVVRAESEASSKNAHVQEMVQQLRKMLDDGKLPFWLEKELDGSKHE